MHIPALTPKAFADDEQLVRIDNLPDWAQAGFAGMKTLNRVQSRVHTCALFSAENMLLCAPTGAGKTNVAMLTILHEIGIHRNASGSINLDAFKIVCAWHAPEGSQKPINPLQPCGLRHGPRVSECQTLLR